MVPGAGAAWLAHWHTGRPPVWGRPERIKIMIYALAFLSLTFVGYLVYDFYCAQLRAQLKPLRARVRATLRKDRRD